MRSLAVSLGLTLLLAGTALAAEPRTSLPDVEDEVMCVQCGTPLNMATSAAGADREREFIRREIRQGKTKEQIKDDLVEIFGPSVLALPEEKGFGLAAYLVPILAALLGLVAVVLAVRRWRGPVAAGEPPAELTPADAERLERELAAHDRES
jgi:cytochrome c-type biogenesis protein CcmH/NrfF